MKWNDHRMYVFENFQLHKIFNSMIWSISFYIQLFLNVKQTYFVLDIALVFVMLYYVQPSNVQNQMSLSSLQMDLANDQKLGIVHIIQMQLSGISRHAKMSRDCLKTIKMRYIAKKGDNHSGSYKHNKPVNKACFSKQSMKISCAKQMVVKPHLPNCV